MKEALIQIAMAGVGTLGFSIYFRVSEKNVIASTVGGIIAWGVYLLIFRFSHGLFTANFIAALIVYLYSEIMARVLKAPSNVFFVPGIIPLIPGGSLYYTMSGIMNSEKEMFIQNGVKTIESAFGIALGIVVGAVGVIYINRVKEKKTGIKK